MSKSNPRRPTPPKVLAAVATGDHYLVRQALTVNQVRFCEEYVLDRNAAGAARRAGYNESGAQQLSFNLMKNEGVKFLIDHLSREHTDKIVTVDPEYVVREIIKVVEKPGASDANKLRGLELLGKHLAMFTEKREITGADGDAIKMQQVQNELSDFTSKLRRVAQRGGEKPTLRLVNSGDEGSS